MLLYNPGYRGIGIDEECAVVVNPDNTIEIVGTGCAMMFEPYKKGEDGGNAHSFKLTVLYPGDKYNIWVCINTENLGLTQPKILYL